MRYIVNKLPAGSIKRRSLNAKVKRFNSRSCQYVVSLSKALKALLHSTQLITEYLTGEP